MAIRKTEHQTSFIKLPRGVPFSAKKVLYTRTDGEEKEEEHLFFKLNNKKAVTVDKRTMVLFDAEQQVTVCEMVAKQPTA